MWIKKVAQALKDENVAFALAGGYAVALHGAVRGTIDIDIVISLTPKNIEAAEGALLALGLKSRLPISGIDMVRFRNDYIQKRNLIAWSFVDYKNPAKVVDILVIEDLKKKDFIQMKIGGFSLPVLTIKKLISMKVKAGRPQDIEDVRALKEIYEKK